MMELYGDRTDYRVKKLLIVAEYLKLSKLTVISDTKAHEQLMCSMNNPELMTVPVLSLEGGIIFQSNAILRYLGKLNQSLNLYGPTFYDQSQIDQWIDFSWNELEVPLAVLLHEKTLSAQYPQEYAKTKAKATAEIQHVLEILNAALLDRVYLVGDNLTLADVAMVCPLYELFVNACPELKTTLAFQKFDQVFRYINTCSGQFPNAMSILTTQAPKSSSSTRKSQPQSKNDTATAAKTKKTKKTKTKSRSRSPVKKTPTTTRQNIIDPTSASSLEQTSAPVLALVDTQINETYRRGRIRVKELLANGLALVDQVITVKGWAKTLREAGAGKFAFLEINDGSCFTGVQVIITQGRLDSRSLKLCRVLICQRCR